MSVEPLRELVVCSLEAWDEIWRRNQFFVEHLLRRNPGLRVLFIEPPTDPIHSIFMRRSPEAPRFRRVRDYPGLIALKPIKALPRRVAPIVDRLLVEQVRLGIRLAGLRRPILWVNDSTYAPLAARCGLPTVYDMTDDWLLAPLSPREVARLASLEKDLFAIADEVVVCSEGLLKSRGTRRELTLIENAVDADHFASPRPRPSDLPEQPVAVYVGTLHASRLDVDLLVDLASRLESLSVVLVGPDSLDRVARSKFETRSNIILLGGRTYAEVPAYLQHADVIIVPHLVNPFTESLDPIKAYESLAVVTPTVATPVAGFRELDGDVIVAPRDRFVAAVEHTLGEKPLRPRSAVQLPSWTERSAAFELVLRRADERRRYTLQGFEARSTIGRG